MILNETVAAIADAIREKTGKSELIKPVDFAEEIKGITAGGGQSDSDEWLYVNYSKFSQVSDMAFMLLGYTYVVKTKVEGNIAISPLCFSYIMGTPIEEQAANIIAVAIGGGMKAGDSQSGLASLVEQVKGLPDIDSCLMTEAEFYDLNA